jgi:enamine deaminase RidA (YjgF/YER057c/UK114 family)
MKREHHDLYNHAQHGPGSYTDSVRVGSTIYLGGQCGYDPQTMKPVSNDFEAQAVQTMKNIEAILGNYGVDCNAIVSMTIYFADCKYFDAWRKVRQRFMTSSAVAATGYVCRIIWPEFLFEVTAIAYIDSAPTRLAMPIGAAS